jgi:hypothetical protein
MQTWIFQGNPDEYDIDGYLASRPGRLSWLVTRYASEIAAGDRVYLWRNQGQQHAIAGVVAEAVVTAPTEMRGEDPEGVRVNRRALGTPPESIKSDTCGADRRRDPTPKHSH